MSEELIIRKLIESLRKYGDHKAKCGISRALRAPTGSDGVRVYPECSCGWTELSLTLK